MDRAYYSASVSTFICENSSSILGKLSAHHEFSLEDLQKNAWIAEIAILKKELANLKDAHISFEYAIPRMGKRVDVIVLYKGIVFVLEFKVGEKKHTKSSINQALDYCLDLKNFHAHSHNRMIVPVIIATESVSFRVPKEIYDDNVHHPILTNKNHITTIINLVTAYSQPCLY